MLYNVKMTVIDENQKTCRKGNINHFVYLRKQ